MSDEGCAAVFKDTKIFDDVQCRSDILVVDHQYSREVDDEVRTARFIAPIVGSRSPTSV